VSEQSVEFAHDGRILVLYQDGVMEVHSDIENEQMAEHVEHLLTIEGGVAAVITLEGNVLSPAQGERSKDANEALSYIGGMIAEGYRLGAQYGATMALMRGGQGPIAPQGGFNGEDYKPKGYL